MSRDGIKLDDGRIVRWVNPTWDESDSRWDEPRDDLSTDTFEELVDGEWVTPSSPISFKEYERKSRPFPDDVEPWD